MTRSKAVLWRMAALSCLSVCSCSPSGSGGSTRASQFATGRPVALRLSGGYAHQPMDSKAAPDRLAVDLMRARKEVFSKAGKPADLVERAHWLLLIDGGSGGPAQAVDELSAAIRLEPDKAERHNDLAAAYWALAESAGNVMFRFDAFEAVERALALEPKMPEALFNRAVIAQELKMRVVAHNAWLAYDKVETDPAWREEALDRRASAVPGRGPWLAIREQALAAAAAGDQSRLQALIDEYRADARRELDERLLPAWARAASQDDQEEARARFQEAYGFAQALSALCGEALYAKTLEEAKTMAGPQRASMARGLLAYRAGLTALDAAETDAALAHFQESASLLNEVDSVFSWRARYQLAKTENWRKNNDEAAREFERIIEELEGKRDFGNLISECHWMYALCSDELGLPGRSLKGYRQGLAIARQQRDAENIAGFLNSLATVFSRLGDPRQSWRHRLEALALLDKTGRLLRHFQTYDGALLSALSQGWPRVALAYSEDAMKVSARNDNPLPLIASLCQRTRILGGSDAAAAWPLLRQARREYEQLPDDDKKSQVDAYILREEAELVMGGDPQKAAEMLKAVLDELETRDDSYLLASVSLAQARAYLSAGDADKAENSLIESIEVLERERGGLLEQEFRIGFFQRAEEVFDEMIALQLTKGRPERALVYAEQSRARALLDLANRAHSRYGEDQRAAMLSVSEPPGDLAELWAQLPPDMTVVSFKFVAEKLQAWVLRQPGETVWTALELDRAEAGDLIPRFRQAIESGASSSELADLGKTLFQALIEPLDLNWQATPRVVFATDGPLHDLPFAALQLENGQWLVEKSAIATAPSIHLFVRALIRNAALDRGEPKKCALAFGNPTIASLPHLGLGALPRSEDEAKGIADVYRARCRDRTGYLIRDQAAIDRLKAAGDYEVIHFAGHAVVDLAQPLRSMLLLAPAGEGDGALSMAELYALRLERTRLVTLSACESARGASLRNEGVASLARPFLASGTPAVVASLWKVDDDPALDLMVAFHRQLAKGLSVDAALQAAQTSMLGKDGAHARPRAWAAFQLIGAGAPLRSIGAGD